MRISGYLLLILGFLLCLTIVWSPVGFLMMSLGLICLMIVAERKKRIKAIATNDFDIDAPQARHSPEAQREPRVSGAVLGRQIEPRTAIECGALIGDDPEIRRIIDVLQAQAPEYIPYLFAEYLKSRDKASLPAIVDRIIASSLGSVEAPLIVEATERSEAVNVVPKQSVEERPEDALPNVEVLNPISTLTTIDVANVPLPVSQGNVGHGDTDQRSVPSPVAQPQANANVGESDQSRGDGLLRRHGETEDLVQVMSMIDYDVHHRGERPN